MEIFKTLRIVFEQPRFRGRMKKYQTALLLQFTLTTILYFLGNTDIHNGNLKLILGLIWSLIAHYQLGASNFPPKKLMLAWLKAVLPDCQLKNFTNDWNNGIFLSALIDYCQPGLMPNWRNLNPNNG